MKHYFLVFLLIPLTLFSSESFDFPDSDFYSDTNCSNSPVINLTGAPSSIVYGCVNVISGDFVDHECDLVVNGLEPLTFERVYSSSDHREGSLYTSWYHNHHATIKTDPEDCYATTRYNNQGTTISIEADTPTYKKPFYDMKPRKDQFEKGYTNCSSGEISGRTNLCNYKMNLLEDRSYATLWDGGGRQQNFTHRTKNCSLIRHCQQTKLGNVINYDIGDSRYVEGINYHNSQGKIGAKIKVSSKFYNPPIAEDPTMHIIAEDGRQVTYHFQLFKHRYDHKVRKDRHLISKVLRPNAPDIEYQYTEPKKHSLERVKSKILPDNRFLNIEYYDELETYELPEGKQKLTKNDRSALNYVYRLSAPVGHDATPIPIATFNYSYGYFGEKSTDRNFRSVRVFNALNKFTDYYWMKQTGKLKEIRRYNSKKELYFSEHFLWSSSNLTYRFIMDKNRNTIFLRYYQYDENKNITKEEIYGNLTGNNFTLPTNQSDTFLQRSATQWYVQTNSDLLNKRYDYSKEDRNLLLKEITPHFSIHYNYEKERPLLNRKLLIENDKIRSRQFFTFDATGAITEKITDNGSSLQSQDTSGVTMRLIERQQNLDTFPLGLPKTTTELYYDPLTNQEIQLKRTTNIYDELGRLLKQETYDKNNNLAFTLEWRYDQHNNVIYETDRLGYEIHRKFDDNDNKIYEQGPDPDYHMTFVYDFSNRLIQQDEVRIDGTCLITKFTYDLTGNKTSSTDCYGNKTVYKYDALDRLVKTILPEVPDENGVLYNPTLKFKYDEFNNLIEYTDAGGNINKTFYTLHGKPFYKEYPDGSFERFEYDVTGALLKEIAKDGSYTLYKNDYLSRPTHINRYDASGGLIESTVRAYDAFNNVYELDPYGIETYYNYDGAGRLIQKKTGETKIVYFYDSLGRVCEERSYFGDCDQDYITKKMKFDKADRLIKESYEDSEGNIQKTTRYSYDFSGNKTQAVFYNQAGVSKLQASYDSQGNPIYMQDPLGNSTHITYSYSHIDSYGINVPCCESVDAKGTITTTISDAIGRTASITKRNPLGAVIQKTEFFYDHFGNKVAQKDNVMVEDELKDIITTHWEYDTYGKVTVIIEAEGTPEQRSSRFYYDSLQRVTEYVKPDGVSIHYNYDNKGRLKEHTASDSSFDYVYYYDRLDHPIKIEDLVQDMTTTRIYTSQGQLAKETLGNGLKIQFDSDYLGRTTALVYPDGSSVSYSYKGGRCSEINRKDTQERTIYAHQYRDYDLSGNCLESKLIGKAGELHQTYDLMNRLVSIEADGWKEESGNYDCVGNLACVNLTDPNGDCLWTYGYDDLYQLNQERGPVSHDYLNDSLANQVKKDGNNQSFNALNQLLENEKGTFVYDLNGNMIRRNCEGIITEYKYDALNRLTEVKTAEETYRYTYDSFNRRIRKQNGDQVVNYLYAGVDEVGTFGADRKFIELRILGVGKGSEIGAAVAMEFNGRAYAPIHDHSGHVRALIDSETGEIQESYRFSAFGEELKCEGSYINPWRFASKRVDPETGFIYFGERYYDPSNARWITNDPLGFDGGPNLYCYVSNRPVALFDLYGMLETGGFWDNVITPLVNTFVNGIKTGLDFCKGKLEKFVNSSIFYPELPSKHSVGSIRVENFLVCFGNGMCNDPEMAKESALMVSNLAGGREVHYMCTPTGGFITDLGRVAITRTFDLNSLSAQEWKRTLEDFFANASPDALALAIAHSEGCTHLNEALLRMPPELRERVIVRAFAPSVFMDPNICHSVVHYCSLRDVVPLTDLYGYIKHRDTVHIVESKKSLWEHGFDSECYQEHLLRELKDYYDGNHKLKPKHKK